MNWDAIGAIAELLGAIGVIASLVYLATQIRQSREQMSQNTQALRAGTYQQLRHELYEAWHSHMMSPGRSKVIQSGMRDFHQLDDESAFQFTFWVVGVMKGYDNACYQYRTGLLDEDRWHLERSDLEGFLESPGVAQWWKSTSRRFSPDFAALVEEILDEQAGRTEGTTD
jgi:hypothetical protein